MYFWTTTSQFDWSLDFFGIQYGEDLFDLQGDKTYVLSHEVQSIDKDKARENDWGEEWKVDEDENGWIPSQKNIIKAKINPSSPFIALPQKLFQRVSEKWQENFRSKGEDAYCSEEFCMVYK